MTSSNELREYFFKGITQQRDELLAAIPSVTVKGTFIITGASNGIGADCALMALRDGYSVIALDKVPFDDAGELPSNRYSFALCDITDSRSLQTALSKAVSEAQTKHILNDEIFLICSAGVYSATDADLCMNVNYHGTRNTIEQIQQTFKNNLKSVTIIGSDQSYFDKNSQRNYGAQNSSKEASYMASKQALRRYFDELYADNSTSWIPCFVAPATVITPLTSAVFADGENSLNCRHLVYENWERENKDIPDGLLHPHHLAYVILNATVCNPQRITYQLVDCIQSGRGILLDGGLNQRAGIIQKSDRFTRFSITREDFSPVTQMMNFE
jgi:NAD(P)-dependent dehydrogenase (short-subunit alcohol dehydrogenase family)